MIFCRADLIAPAAKAWIETTRTAGVLNVFDRACNLVNPDDGILTLLAAGAQMNPFAVRVADAGSVPFREVLADMPALVRRDRLTLPGLRVQLDRPDIWNPRPDWPAVKRTLRADPTILNQIGEAAAEYAPRGSLLDLWGNGSTLGRDQAGEAPGQATLIDRARRYGAKLIGGLGTSLPEAAMNGARGLAGLGGGLTPAGDDFIVGVLLAAWAGLHEPGAEQMGPLIAEAAASRTTTVSAAYLRAAARGECTERWHRLFATIGDRRAEQVRLAVRGLSAVGHTSGADALAGFLAGEASLSRAT